MAYVNQAGTARRPGTIIAVGAIHALLGYGLIVGLAGGAFTKIDAKNPGGIFVPAPPPPPPPEQPEPKPEVKNTPQTAPLPYIPPTPNALPRDDAPLISSSDIIVSSDNVLELAFPPGPVVEPKPEPAPVPKFKPKAASPRNTPAGWITDRDYKSRWVREEMVGTAKFRLDIAANGKVTNCTITGSTGHKQLDTATCDLVTKRARFTPSTGADGKPVTSSYSNAVTWQLPE